MAMNTNYKTAIHVGNGVAGVYVKDLTKIQDYSGSKPVDLYNSVDVDTFYSMSKGDPNYKLGLTTKDTSITNTMFYVQPDGSYSFELGAKSPKITTETGGFTYSIGVSTSEQHEERNTAAYIVAVFEKGSLTQADKDTVIKLVKDAGGIPDKPKPKHNVNTSNISYCTTDAPTTIEDGETLNVVITPNSGYEFSKDGTWYEGDGSEPNSVAHKFTPTGTTYTLSIPNVKTDIDVWLVATKKNVVPETVTYVEHLSHCTSSHTGDKINKGSTDITFTADEGYEFSTKGTWFQQSDPSMPAQDTDFFPTDKHQFTVTLEDVYAPVTVTLSATAPVVTTATAFSNLYLTNDGELGTLATERFYGKPEGDTVSVDIIDYGEQILNLLRLPFAIPEAIQGTEKKPIQLGNHTTTVESTPILSDTVKLNVGKITVPETYKNVIDYRYSDCILHLPFVDEMKLDIEYTIGYTITIYYLVNLYTGKATLILSSSKTGTVFHTEQINIGQKLPFIQLSDNTNYSSYGSPVYMGIKQAYIDVISQPPVKNATMRVNEHGKLKDYTGYTEASTLNLTTSATVSEQQDIQQLLNQGVYINETTVIS